jgi:hypothetical protein
MPDTEAVRTAGPAILAALVAIAGCGDVDDGARGRVRDAPAAEADSVAVWFSRGERTVPVPRSAVGAPLDAALRELVRGPTPEERAEGLTSWFNDSTSGVLRRVRAESSHVTVDFHDDLRRLAPGAGSSSGSEQLLMALDSTVFQFSWVRTAEYRMEGSCEEFWAWLQRECTVVRR